MKNISFFLLLVFIPAFCLASPQGQEKQVVKIGAIVPLTGSLAHAGAAFRDAMRMALDEVPHDSRFSYELIVEDDGLRASQVATVAQKLINLDHVDAIISTWSYGGIVVAPLAERAKVIHFGVAWDPMVAKGRFNFIHLAPPKTFLPVFLEIFNRLGYKKIATIGMIESGSEFCLTELERLTKNSPFSIIERDTMNYGDFDFRSIIARIEKKHPDIYFTNFGTIENDLFMKQATNMQVKTPITSITGFDVSENLSLLEGRWYVSDSIMPESFSKRFVERYHHQRLYGVGNFYDAVNLIVDRYEHAPGKSKPEPESLLERMKDLTDFHSVFGTLAMDEEGIISYPVQCREVKNGKRETIPCGEIHK